MFLLGLRNLKWVIRSSLLGNINIEKEEKDLTPVWNARYLQRLIVLVNALSSEIYVDALFKNLQLFSLQKTFIFYIKIISNCYYIVFMSLSSLVMNISVTNNVLSPPTK